MRVAYSLSCFATIAGGMALYWWFFHGSWRVHGHTVIERDLVRFGPYPLIFSRLWFVSLVASLWCFFPRIDRS
jgi:hypothetical protein